MLRPTHNEADSKGDFLGFEGRSGMIPAVLGFAGILFASLLITVRNTPIIPTIVLCFAPAVASAVIILMFVSGKPPGYLRDYVLTSIGRSALSFRSSDRRNPYRTSE